MTIFRNYLVLIQRQCIDLKKKNPDCSLKMYTSVSGSVCFGETVHRLYSVGESGSIYLLIRLEKKVFSMTIIS